MNKIYQFKHTGEYFLTDEVENEDGLIELYSMKDHYTFENDMDVTKDTLTNEFIFIEYAEN